jgi:uncharacterized protein
MVPDWLVPPHGGHLLLVGVVGSHAYGLATDASDVDRLGVYAAPTELFHGLHPPVGKAATKVYGNLVLADGTTRHDPGDATLHEAGKFASLCLAANPTTLELLWLSEYETDCSVGAMLVDIRSAFPSAARVRDAYLGYAAAQCHRLLSTDVFRPEMAGRVRKHARHLLRLLDQGAQLYTTGELTVALSDPQRYLDFGEAVLHDPEAAKAAFNAGQERFDAASPLPQRPDEDTVEDWLRMVRRHYLPLNMLLAHGGHR